MAMAKKVRCVVPALKVLKLQIHIPRAVDAYPAGVCTRSPPPEIVGPVHLSPKGNWISSTSPTCAVTAAFASDNVIVTLAAEGADVTTASLGHP